jgi:hypothetical protein
MLMNLCAGAAVQALPGARLVGMSSLRRVLQLLD